MEGKFLLNQYTILIDKSELAELIAECESTAVLECELINRATTMQPQILRSENSYREATEHHIYYRNSISLEHNAYKVTVVGLHSPDGLEEYAMFNNSLRDVYISLKT